MIRDGFGMPNMSRSPDKEIGGTEFICICRRTLCRTVKRVDLWGERMFRSANSDAQSAQIQCRRTAVTRRHIVREVVSRDVPVIG